MLYRPTSGKMKDGCLWYENGVFYLFSMYQKEGSESFCNVWLATSEDGVHFRDCGCVVEDFSDPIWAMKVYRGEDAFYMNSGSFTEDEKQAVLKFWRSEDLLHWEYRPELDVIAPNRDDPKVRLDCMNVLKHDGKYYGYATGQYSFLTSEDGAHWTPHKARMDYTPFPSYNPALGGFEIADILAMEKGFYLLCGGFGHMGVNGYGVYLYKASAPDGVFAPSLPYYRLNGTSKRWVNMWERIVWKDGEPLAHNYIYDGFTYEQGRVYLPPIKRIRKEGERVFLSWWEQNALLYGERLTSESLLVAESPRHDVFTVGDPPCSFSEVVELPDAAVLECKLTLTENRFTKYSAGGVALWEEGDSATVLLFDTYGSFRILHTKGSEVLCEEDTVGFGSTALYHLESGKTYDLRILTRNGLFEIYVNNVYLQTFNNAHASDRSATPFKGVCAASQRNICQISDLNVYEMKIK